MIGREGNAANMVNLNDTTDCPDNGGQCEACGRRPARADAVATLYGTCCVARCPQCSEAGEVPPAWLDNGDALRTDVAKRVLRHCVHLRIHPEEMSLAMMDDAQRPGG